MDGGSEMMKMIHHSRADPLAAASDHHLTLKALTKSSPLRSRKHGNRMVDNGVRPETMVSNSLCNAKNYRLSKAHRIYWLQTN